MIERATHAAGALGHHVRVDHGGLNIGVSEQFLHGAYVVAALEQMRRETVTQRAAARRLGDAGLADRRLYRALNDLLVQMMAYQRAREPIPA